MANGLPPPPVNDQPGSFAWLEWYRQLRNYVSTSGSVPWYIINFSGSNLTDIASDYIIIYKDYKVEPPVK